MAEPLLQVRFSYCSFSLLSVPMVIILKLSWNLLSVNTASSLTCQKSSTRSLEAAENDFPRPVPWLWIQGEEHVEVSVKPIISRLGAHFCLIGPEKLPWVFPRKIRHI